ncbi:hypothetical protein KC333_g1868 [Hortaea werneckii]|nr:hypothetical protein KC342_g10973 [Hortaea werneckii]KAI6904919.1 hypothetical protein KC334_g6402 [Hortaea werneckii]KAI7013686.1 hypothetical protein KC355_g4946 [Hortaea werneckii]KAI7090613.1 hypothetical protein KC339_g12619 [Hortaea werneckii]KAI7188889.1 hypothetical protein KC324_g6478 [Hortaea werneckii]
MSRFYSSSTDQTSRHDPGQLVIFFDNRHCGPLNVEDDKMSRFQHAWLSGLTRMGWPSWWQKPDLEVGKLRLVFYTHAGAEGHRDYPLHLAYTVLEMFNSLTDEGFRPFVLGWSGENPFPMIGGAEPPDAPKKALMPQVKRSAAPAYSGHRCGPSNSTPHERIMAIIAREEEREAKKRAEEVQIAEKAGEISV